MKQNYHEKLNKDKNSEKKQDKLNRFFKELDNMSHLKKNKKPV